MRRLFDEGTFHDFGSSRLRPTEWKPVTCRYRGRTSALRQNVIGEAPKIPGVYGMLDRDGRLIYVGKAKSLRCRLMSYFRPNSRHPKAGRIIEQTRTLIWETAHSEFAALLRELELIRRFLPRFNSQGKPGRARYMYLCLGRGPAPYAYLARRVSGKPIACYGPLTSRAEARDAVRRLNDHFGLRDCAQSQRMNFADQQELFPILRTPGCLRYELGTCLGPCVGGCSTQKYQRQLDKVRAFLEGRDGSALEELEQEMSKAAEALQYERAGALRDKILGLSWLTDRLTWLRQARDEHSFVYRSRGSDARPMWYMIHRGQVREVIREPRTEKQKARVPGLLSDAFRESTEDGPTVPIGEVDSVLLVAAWFRRHPAEREHLMSREETMARVMALQSTM